MMLQFTAVAGLLAVLAFPGLAAAEGAPQGRWNAYPGTATWRAPLQSVESPRQGFRDGTPRDPTGILRGQGVSSLYGGMGNMGGGSGRSANTGVGLGGIGANQGARF